MVLRVGFISQKSLLTSIVTLFSLDTVKVVVSSFSRHSYE